MANNRELSQFANVVGYNGGNVGIGTDDPDERLEVGDGTVSGALKVSGQSSSVTSDGFTVDWESSSNSTRIFSEPSSGGSSAIRFFTTNSGTRAEKLRISGVGTVMLRANQGSAETNVIRFEDTDTSVAANQKFGQLQWYSNDASGAGPCVKGEIYVAAQDTTPDGYMVFATHDGGSSTVATERMRISSEGNVGINTTSNNDSAHFQHYQSEVRHQSFQSANGDLAIVTDNNTNPAAYIKGTGTADLLKVVSGSTTVFRIEDDGQATVDKGAPGSANQVIGRFQAESTRRLDVVWHDSGSLLGFDTPSNHSLIFKTNGSERMRILQNGNGVQIAANSSGDVRLQFNGNGTRLHNTTAGGHIDLYTNNAVRNRFLYNGQGTEFSNQNRVIPTTDNAVDLGASGARWDDVYATNGTIQTSDSRLKREVETSVLGIDFVKALRPVSYKWIESKKIPIVDGTDENGDNTYRTDADGNWVYESRDGARRHWGFIAQEVKQVVDDANVDFAGWSLADKDDSNSTQSLRYEEFISPLTKALQEAIAKIETLETQNADLLARVTALEGS